jgi:hypothetical protein
MRDKTVVVDDYNCSHHALLRDDFNNRLCSVNLHAKKQNIHLWVGFRVAINEKGEMREKKF